MIHLLHSLVIILKSCILNISLSYMLISTIEAHPKASAQFDLVHLVQLLHKTEYLIFRPLSKKLINMTLIYFENLFKFFLNMNFLGAIIYINICIILILVFLLLQNLNLIFINKTIFHLFWAWTQRLNLWILFLNYLYIFLNRFNIWTDFFVGWYLFYRLNFARFFVMSTFNFESYILRFLTVLNTLVLLLALW